MSLYRLKTLATVSIAGILTAAIYFGEEGDVQPSKQQDPNVDAMALLFQKIAQNILLKAPAGPETTFGELWKDHRCVIIFFRRFG